MSVREESSNRSGRGKRAEKAVAESREANQKALKVVEVNLPKGGTGTKLTVKNPAGRKSSLLRRVAKKANAAAAAVDDGPIIDLKDSAQTDRLIKTFRKVSAAQVKNRPVPPRISYANFLAKPPSSGKKYALDLRVHTPGTVGYFTSGGVEPGPALVRLARVKGIDILGLTDFYNASFIDIVHNSVDKPEMSIIPGVDLCCVVGPCRETHITALFPESYRTADLFAFLNELRVPRSAYGRSDYVLELPFAEVLQAIESRGGIAIPTQLDKTPYRQLAIPTLVEKFGIRAFDLTYPENTDFFRERWPAGQFTFFSFSNSTALAQIGSRIAKVKLTTPTFEGIKELVTRKLKAE